MTKALSAWPHATVGVRLVARGSLLSSPVMEESASAQRIPLSQWHAGAQPLQPWFVSVIEVAFIDKGRNDKEMEVLEVSSSVFRYCGM